MSSDAAPAPNPESTAGSLSAHFQSHPPGISYVQYALEKEPEYLPQIRELISKDLSEPYSIYVYRYFLYQWAELCFMAIDTTDENKLAGVVICKLEPHRGGPMRGYIAMLATVEQYRGRGIATKLVCMAIDAMKDRGADEVRQFSPQMNDYAS